MRTGKKQAQIITDGEQSKCKFSHDQDDVGRQYHQRIEKKLFSVSEVKHKVYELIIALSFVVHANVFNVYIRSQPNEKTRHDSSRMIENKVRENSLFFMKDQEMLCTLNKGIQRQHDERTTRGK
jgi:hypothetical protein